MLQLAHVGSEDILYDLGCGDGRILITAIQEFDVKKAIGYEIQTDLYYNALEKIKRAGLEEKIRIVNEDLMIADLTEASVITLYLTLSGNKTLKCKLLREANNGTRIVSHDFHISGWAYTIKDDTCGHSIYLYTLPEAMKKDAMTCAYTSFNPHNPQNQRMQ
jgi:hypothetical protein